MNNNFIPSQNEITFEEVYKKYSPDIFLYAFHTLNQSKESAEDITNETFTILWEKWENFNPKTYPVLLSWLRKTALFLAYNSNRKAQKLSTVPIDDIKNHENASDPLGEYIYQEDLQRIQEGLTAEEYLLFEKIVVYNQSIKRIAPEMNLAPRSLSVRWFRLKSKLRKILSEN